MENDMPGIRICNIGKPAWGEFPDGRTGKFFYRTYHGHHPVIHEKIFQKLHPVLKKY